jgi:3-oxoadipate enol-lactonase
VLSVATVRRAAEVLTGATLTVVDGAPHSMYWETPEKFNAAVERFLEQVYGPAGKPAPQLDGQVTR